jgi:hypothetical protein
MDIEQVVESVGSKNAEGLQAAAQRLKDVRRRALDFVIEHPVIALAGTFLLGFALARVARRS